MNILALLLRTVVYAPTTDQEAIRIDHIDADEQEVYGTGEESGEQYCIAFDEFDLENAIFYELTPINLTEVQ